VLLRKWTRAQCYVTPLRWRDCGDSPAGNRRGQDDADGKRLAQAQLSRRIARWTRFYPDVEVESAIVRGSVDRYLTDKRGAGSVIRHRLARLYDRSVLSSIMRRISAWCSVKNPRSASSSWAVLLRARPLASWASARIALPGDQRLHHPPFAHAVQFREHRRDLDLGVLEQFSMRCCSRVRSCTKATTIAGEVSEGAHPTLSVGGRDNSKQDQDDEYR